MRHIDSPRNVEIKELLKLKDRRGRERSGRFLIEGRREVERAAAANIRIERLYLQPDMPAAAGLRKLAEGLAITGVEIVELSEAAFTRLSMRENPDGALALAETWEVRLDDLELPRDPLLLVVDSLEKPGNLGALLRTADAVKADATIVTGQGTDLFNPNVVRASMGSLFSRPVVAADTAETIDWLKRRGFSISATSPGAHQSYWEIDYRPGTAVVLGSEHDGLSMEWLEAADHQVLVPMHGMADSLNVATTGALLLYEALRQRSTGI